MINNDSFYKVEVYLLEDNLNEIIKQLNNSNACHVGLYDCCMSWYYVNSSWRPLNGSKPYLGTVGKVEYSQEIKLEFICQGKYLKETVDLIRQCHSYETANINIFELINV